MQGPTPNDPMTDPPSIDSHAHVWDRTCSMIDGARYHPDYEATIDTYLDVLDAHGIERAVLVQPSFLGTDNTYLLACLRAHPDRLRGIVVLAPEATDSELDDLSALGVIGLRYNLLSLDPSCLNTSAYQSLTQRSVARNWWIEVQAKGSVWPEILPVLRDVRLMVDHFGLPGSPDCPGYDVLSECDPAQLCIKLSAPYRQEPIDLAKHARTLADTFGAERCLWGSDWPWTQHEFAHSYDETVHWLDAWTSPQDRIAMAKNAENLLGFDTGPELGDA